MGENAAGTLNPEVLRDWVDRAVKALDARRVELDALNVFPVADSDTGTNLLLTVREGREALARVAVPAPDREAVRAFARGALVGARGNSGVILSQYLGALLRTLAVEQCLAGGILARGLCTATEAAYRAVAHPVEGTVLTVARAVGDGAIAAAGQDGPAPGVTDVLEAGLERGYEALGRTTAQLAPLMAAGVLDAGAWGLLLVLDALADALRESTGCPRRAERPVPAMPVRHLGGGQCGVDSETGVRGGEFEVMYLVVAGGRDPATGCVSLGDASAADVAGDGAGGEFDPEADALRSALSAIGDSVAVVGGDGLWQAHVHTDTPLGAVYSAGVAGAQATQIRVRHLASQSGVHGAHRPPLGLVTVTGAPALAADLARAGAVVVLVPPGRVAGPELERAIIDTGARTVLVLGANELLGGIARVGPRVVDRLSEVQVVVGAATLASLDPRLGEDLLAEAVLEAVDAVRTAVVPGVGPTGHADRAADAVRELLVQPTSLITVLTSVQTPQDVVERVIAEVGGSQIEVIVLATGAPGDQVVLGAE